MSRPRAAWTATVRLRTGRGALGRWLEQALSPEAAREVPRARTALHRDPHGLELRVEADDAGAMRAALNTYLGWVALSLATLRAAGTRPPVRPPRSRGEALISRSR